LVKVPQALLVALLLAVMLQPPPAAAAGAADPVVAQAALAGRLYQLGGVTLYQRQSGPRTPAPPHWIVRGPWVRVVNGRSRTARHIPAAVGAGNIGRDARGRIVMTYFTQATRGDRSVPPAWFIYDVMSDRSRPIKGLNEGTRCSVVLVTIWRTRTAYEKDCGAAGSSGLFVRTGTMVEQIAPAEYTLVDMAQRGDSLAGIVDDDNGDLHLYRFLDGGRRCVKEIPTGYGPGEGPWYPTGVWFSGDQIVWTMGRFRTAPSFAVLAANRAGSCEPLGPTGELPFTPETVSVRALGVDAGRLVYAGGKLIKAHQLPAQPSFDPPANDDFEQAEVLPTRLPFRVSGRIGYATRQPGEPTAIAPGEPQPWNLSRTVWYAFRPTSSGTVYVGSTAYSLGRYTYGVFTGSSIDSLTQIPPDARGTKFDAEAGQTYWIAVNAESEEPDYRPFYLSIVAGDTPPE
jgi:hypothetical protein